MTEREQEINKTLEDGIELLRIAAGFYVAHMDAMAVLEARVFGKTGLPDELFEDFYEAAAEISMEFESVEAVKKDLGLMDFTYLIECVEAARRRKKLPLPD